jgi:ABC-type glycerol-3-phosphate transport system substrate-binding protein
MLQAQRKDTTMQKRWSLVLTLTLVVGLLLAGCVGSAPASAPSAPASASGSEQSTTETTVNWLMEPDASKLPPTTIRYWYYESPERIALGEQQKAAFEALYPNITVDGSTAPDAVDNDMLVAFIRAGTNSHVHQSVSMEDTWYLTRNLLLPLEDLPGFQEVWERMDPDLNYTWKDGHVYSISWYAGPRVMFYNGQRVREAGLDADNPPQTYSEFLAWAEALSGDGKWFINLSPLEEWWRWQFTGYPFYIAATGSNQMTNPEGTQAIFNSPEALQSFQLIDTLFAKGYNLTEAVQGNPFLSGQVAATLSGAALLGTIKRTAPPDFEVIVGPVPKPDGSTVQGFPTYNFVRNFAIMREQHRQGADADIVNRAAWELMKFLLSEEQLAADFAATGDLPPTRDLLTNPAYTALLDALPAGRAYAAYNAESFIWDMNTALGSEIIGILTRAYVDMIFDAKTPEEALAWAEQEVNSLLASQ